MTRHPNPTLWLQVQRFAFVALIVWAVCATLWAGWPDRMPS